jgi:adenosylhomocysteine nucleosidase
MGCSLPGTRDSGTAVLERPLVCFAVKEERRFFSERGAEILITGMGRLNVEKTLNSALKKKDYSIVISCGFAGALNPALRVGTVVFQADADTGLAAPLLSAGATPAKFHFSDRVATTATEKKLLRQETGADAVEMESEAIRSICKALGIPAATVRVISDAAEENLPLDFNELMSAEQRLDYGRLLWSVLRSPGKIPALLRLQRQTKLAAKKLAEVLGRIIPPQA